MDFRLKAQLNPTIGVISEYTVIGDFTGVYGGVVISDVVNTGVYYEGGLFRTGSEFNPTSTLFGAYANWIYLKDARIKASILFRAGVKDNQFVFIVPDAAFGIRVLNQLQISALMGIRAEFPAIGIGLTYFVKKSKSDES